jgi:hypothetical protein
MDERREAAQRFERAGVPTRQVMFCAITSSFVVIIMDIDDLIV